LSPATLTAMTSSCDDLYGSQYFFSIDIFSCASKVWSLAQIVQIPPDHSIRTSYSTNRPQQLSFLCHKVRSLFIEIQRLFQNINSLQPKRFRNCFLSNPRREAPLAVAKADKDTFYILLYSPWRMFAIVWSCMFDVPSYIWPTYSSGYQRLDTFFETITFASR
jgi:hypothetical protein